MWAIAPTTRALIRNDSISAILTDLRTTEISSAHAEVPAWNDNRSIFQTLVAIHDGEAVFVQVNLRLRHLTILAFLVERKSRSPELRLLLFRAVVSLRSAPRAFSFGSLDSLTPDTSARQIESGRDFDSIPVHR